MDKEEFEWLRERPLSLLTWYVSSRTFSQTDSTNTHVQSVTSTPLLPSFTLPMVSKTAKRGATGAGWVAVPTSIRLCEGYLGVLCRWLVTESRHGCMAGMGSGGLGVWGFAQNRRDDESTISKHFPFPTQPSNHPTFWVILRFTHDPSSQHRFAPLYSSISHRPLLPHQLPRLSSSMQ